MDREQMLAWGKSVKYARIVLSRNPYDALKKGEESWEKFVEQRDPVRWKLLEERKEYWERTYERKGN